MTRVVFEQVVAHGNKSGVCPGCHKYMRRQRKFINTVNPWNKNPDGTVKTRDQVQADVDRAAAEFEAKPVMHEKCEELV